MSYPIHDLSTQALLSELDLFSVPPTQVSVDRSVETEHKPNTSLSKNVSPIEFKFITAPNEYVLLDQSYITFVFKLSSPTAVDWNSIKLSRNLLGSIIHKIDLIVNGKEISTSPQSYAYRSYFENLIGYSQSAKSNHS